MSYQKTDADKLRNAERKKEWYRENRETQYARIKANQKRLADWLAEYKKTIKCSRCPENHPAALDFHHKDPSKKLGTMANLARKGWSIKKLLTEIDKCDVLCFNCHRKLHWQEKNGRISPLSDKESKG